MISSIECAGHSEQHMVHTFRTEKYVFSYIERDCTLFFQSLSLSVCIMSLLSFRILFSKHTADERSTHTHISSYTWQRNEVYAQWNCVHKRSNENTGQLLCIKYDLYRLYQSCRNGCFGWNKGIKFLGSFHGNVRGKMVGIFNAYRWEPRKERKRERERERQQRQAEPTPRIIHKRFLLISFCSMCSCSLFFFYFSIRWRSSDPCRETADVIYKSLSLCCRDGISQFRMNVCLFLFLLFRRDMLCSKRLYVTLILWVSALLWRARKTLQPIDKYDDRMKLNTFLLLYMIPFHAWVEMHLKPSKCLWTSKITFHRFEADREKSFKVLTLS